MRALCVVPLLLAACGPHNHLEGSIAEDMSLAFSEVEILKQGEALRVEYLKRIAGERDKVCKVVVDTAELGLESGTMIRRDLFLERVVIQRSSADHLDFPPPEGGTLQLHDFEFVDDGYVSGDFDVAFEGGKSLRGSFAGEVLAVD